MGTITKPPAELLRINRDYLEGEIHSLIIQFEKETGMTIEEIDLQRIDISSKENSNKNELLGVHAKIIL